MTMLYECSYRSRVSYLVFFASNHPDTCPSVDASHKKEAPV